MGFGRLSRGEVKLQDPIFPLPPTTVVRVTEETEIYTWVACCFAKYLIEENEDLFTVSSRHFYIPEPAMWILGRALVFYEHPEGSWPGSWGLDSGVQAYSQDIS